MSAISNTSWLRVALLFPFHERRGRGQFVLVVLVYTALLVSFAPLAPVMSAGYAMQVARRVLLDESNLALPDEVNWQAIFIDGIRRWGLALIFCLPGLALTIGSTVALFFAWYGFSAQEGFQLVVWMIVFGMSIGILFSLVGIEVSGIASIHMLIRGSFTAGFAIHEWVPILLERLPAFEIAALALLAGGIALFILETALLLPAMLVCIGPPLIFSGGAVYLSLVSTVIYARIYRDGSNQLSDNQRR